MSRRRYLFASRQEAEEAYVLADIERGLWAMAFADGAPACWPDAEGECRAALYRPTSASGGFVVIYFHGQPKSVAYLDEAYASAKEAHERSPLCPDRRALYLALLRARERRDMLLRERRP